MEYFHIALLLLSACSFIEVKEHNKKVDETYPDITDPEQFRMKSRFHIEMVSHYLLLFAAIIYFVYRIIRSIT